MANQPNQTPQQQNSSDAPRWRITFSVGLGLTIGLICIALLIQGLAIQSIGFGPFSVHFSAKSSDPSSSQRLTHGLQPQSPAPSSLTVDQVRSALPTPSDLSNIDANLTYHDVAFPIASGCHKYSVQPTINVNRELEDGGTLTLVSGIEVFRSPGDAHITFDETAKQFTCSFTSTDATSNISGDLSGLCDESFAMAITAMNDSNVVLSYYSGEVRCGRLLVFFGVITSPGSQFDDKNNLTTGMQVSIPKVQGLQ